MKSRVSRRVPWLAGLLFAVAAAPAQAQGVRLVLVNGELLDEQGLALVDELNCGETVPNGNYWLDLENRRWGHVGQGDEYPLPDCAAGLAGSGESPPAEGGDDDCESRYPVWEDRMCYCHNMCM